MIDGIDGTVAFAAGHAGGWCSAVALEDDRGPLVAAVWTRRASSRRGARRGDGQRRADPLRAAAAGPTPTSRPSCARTGSSLPGVRATAHALLDHAGLIRHAGPGSLELAWVAAGRLDAWI